MSDGKSTPSAKFRLAVSEKKGKVIGSYISGAKPVEVECERGHKWSAKPSFILATWCEECAKVTSNPLIDTLKELEVDMTAPFVLPEMKEVEFSALVTIGESKILYSIDTEEFFTSKTLQESALKHMRTCKKLGYLQVRIEPSLLKDKDKLFAFLDATTTDDKPFQVNDATAYPFFFETSPIGDEPICTIFDGESEDDGRAEKMKKHFSIEYLEPPEDITDKKAIVLYARVSSVAQLDGFSLESQRMEAERYTVFVKGYLKAVYRDEGVSGRKFKEREALQQLLLDVKRGDIVFVKSLSRLSRQLRDIIFLKDTLDAKGVTIYVSDFSLDTSTSIGTLVFHIMASFCQFESEQIGDRVRGVMKDQRMSDKAITKPPFGWKKSAKKGESLLPDEDEQKTIAFIREKKLKDPSISLKALCTILDEGKYACRKCKMWYPSRLREIMINNEISTAHGDRK